jgi:TonB family protein
MAKLLFLSTSLRTAPVALSIVAHAAFAVAAGLGGHARTSGSPGVAEIDIELAPTPAREVPQDIPGPKADEPVAFPTHTHKYPVQPDHDAHPHDPSIVHDHSLMKAMPLKEPAGPVMAASEKAPSAAPASDAVLGSSSSAPVFTIALGHAPVSSGGVTSINGTGMGGVGARVADADEPAVPESLVTSRARLVSQVMPPYPSAARNLQIEADVGLEIVVDTAGVVADARVVRHAGYGMDEAALAAVRRALFVAARRDGRPVRVRMPWVVQFHLD